MSSALIIHDRLPSMSGKWRSPLLPSLVAPAKSIMATQGQIIQWKGEGMKSKSWEEYEIEKKHLQRKNLSPKEYEEEIRKLTKRLGL